MDQHGSTETRGPKGKTNKHIHCLLPSLPLARMKKDEWGFWWWWWWCLDDRAEICWNIQDPRCCSRSKAISICFYGIVHCTMPCLDSRDAQLQYFVLSGYRIYTVRCSVTTVCPNLPDASAVLAMFWPVYAGLIFEDWQWSSQNTWKLAWRRRGFELMRGSFFSGVNDAWLVGGPNMKGSLPAIRALKAHRGAAAEGDRCCRSKNATGWGFGKIAAECCQQTGPRAASDQEHCEDNFRWDGWPEWDPGACLANCPRHAVAVQGKPRCWGWLFMIVCHHLSSVLIRIFPLGRNHFKYVSKSSQWLVQIDARMGIDMYWPRASGCETVWRGAHEACQPWCAFFVAGQSWRWWDQNHLLVWPEHGGRAGQSPCCNPLFAGKGRRIPTSSEWQFPLPIHPSHWRLCHLTCEAWWGTCLSWICIGKFRVQNMVKPLNIVKPFVYGVMHRYARSCKITWYHSISFRNISK